MIALGKKKSMQYMLLEAQEVAEQCVIIVVDELSCCWPVSWVQTSPDSTTNDSFDAISIIRRREAPPDPGRVEQFGIARRICRQLAALGHSCRGGAAL